MRAIYCLGDTKETKLYKVCFVAALCFLPLGANANGAFNYFWSLNGMPPPQVTSSIPTEGYPQSDLIYTPPTGTFSGFVIASQCSGTVTTQNTTKSYTYWLEYPSSGKSDTGLSWDMSFSKVGDLQGPSPSIEWGGRPGFMVMVASQQPDAKANGQTCLSVGSESSSVSLPKPAPLTGTLKLKRDELFSGIHTIKVDLYNAVEEHYKDGSVGNLYLKAAAFTALSTPTTATIILDVKIRCDVSIKSMTISHGVVGNREREHKAISRDQATLSCENGSATATISIKGSIPVSGSASNVTKCGDFTCELKLNVGDSVDVVTKQIFINKGSQVSIIPTSTLHIPENAPVGSFDGAGVINIIFD
ncbi:hypothetical protein ACWIJ6_17805 [Aeromonas piscicola]